MRMRQASPVSRSMHWRLHAAVLACPPCTFLADDDDSWGWAALDPRLRFNLCKRVSDAGDVVTRPSARIATGRAAAHALLPPREARPNQPHTTAQRAFIQEHADLVFPVCTTTRRVHDQYK